MHIKGESSDILRASVSSAPSTSSHGSIQDDCESLGDVYVWGEVFCNSSTGNISNKISSSTCCRADFLLPKPLESNLLLDVHHVACGVHHAALVTKQGEVFTWGEEFGGCLGQGVRSDVIHPHLVESLSDCNVEIVACGEFHTCAVTITGELYTWGDGTHNLGLLGHGTNISHWIPKRVSGPLDGLHVAYVTCGTWHTALITSTWRLFTFGDGTFGALGHGSQESILYPKEVEYFMGLKTISVACGVWHTAAVVEGISTNSGVNFSSGKLFTWGDGDKYRLGHGDREPRFKPTCVASIVDCDFHKVACGHNLTIGLTTYGQVFTMGSAVYGQLGDPCSDGKLPCLVEDELLGEAVAEIACGSHHVAVLTTKSEVFTWGRGANGRLGHGDIEDRKTPIKVEALRDRSVRYIACGANFTVAICQHKWVSGSEQSRCGLCGQPFGFTRKRHNCYNCGLVYCHPCTSNKSFRAALSPNPGKPYRVCDSCYVKLNKVVAFGGTFNNKKDATPYISSKERLDKDYVMKNLDMKAAKSWKRTIILVPQISSVLQLKDIVFAGGIDSKIADSKAVWTLVGQSVNSSRAVSPFSQNPSPVRSATPVPLNEDLSFYKSAADNLKKANELLEQEIKKLQAQVDILRHRCDLQEIELEKSAKKAQEAMVVAAEESAKSNAAKEVIKSLTIQLKDMAERSPQGVVEGKERKSSMEAYNTHHASMNRSIQTMIQNGVDEQMKGSESNGDKEMLKLDSPADDNVCREAKFTKDGENGSKSQSSISTSNQVGAEWIEQYESGVYITLSALHDGTRDIKRVRFSRRRFKEQQAEVWWSENRKKVFERYNARGSCTASSMA
ncbi:probable E3 ubiquitin-protein ligase HERC2 [Ananas comosus]|uniref:Probable E3 ubiquitin-protein ligase HERC2 n=1 Tax=Ananas comosus TaxID=4615 RepID=A0A6P5GGZ2_ANACO|nr:probable E3 ubiquitin-protein ligase HERC2 [Ananas comosus]